MGRVSATEFFSSLPAGTTRAERDDRENQIVEAVKSGSSMPVELRELRSEHGSRVAKIRVMRDAVRIGESGDAVRPAMTPIGAQRIADALGLMLPTAKIVELAWRQGYQISPTTMKADAAMATTKRIVEHSRKVDEKLHGVASDRSRVVGANVGKHWVLSNAAVGKTSEGAPAFANFGWFRHPSNTLDLWQPVSTRHGTFHVDYSQIVWLVHPIVEVDGEPMPLAKVAADPELAPLVFGPIPYDTGTTLSTFRVPGVPLPHEVDPKNTLDVRALMWCLHEAGRYGDRQVDPSRVRQYLEGCVRRGNNLGLKVGNFCSAAQGFAEHEVALEGEELPPWRAAAKEHITDAKSRADLEWIPVEDVLEGKRVPPIGAKAIYHRGKPGAWTGHIDRVVEVLPPKSGDRPTHYRNVGANERGGRWVVEDSSFANPMLIGFVAHVAPEPAVAPEPKPEPPEGPSVVAPEPKPEPVVEPEPPVPDDAVEPDLTDEDRALLRWNPWALCSLALDALIAIRDAFLANWR